MADGTTQTQGAFWLDPAIIAGKYAHPHKLPFGIFD